MLGMYYLLKYIFYLYEPRHIFYQILPRLTIKVLEEAQKAVSSYFWFPERFLCNYFKTVKTFVTNKMINYFSNIICLYLFWQALIFPARFENLITADKIDRSHKLVKSSFQGLYSLMWQHSICINYASCFGRLYICDV